jgi:hypothetical protein
MKRKNLRKWLVLGGLLAFVSVANADFNVQDKGTYYNNASTGLKTDVNGNLATNDFDRDRDFPLITQLFSGQQLTAGQTYQMNTSIPMMQYTRAAIMLTWAAAVTDTDSVRIAVRVYGTTSPSSANWHLWTPMAEVNATDSCYTSGPVAADSNGTGRCLKPLSFWVGRSVSTVSMLSGTLVIGSAGLHEGPAIVRTRVRKIPGYALRWGSANGVMLNLTDNTGAPCPFPYIRLEVVNATLGTTITNVEANLWPRVQ